MCEECLSQVKLTIDLQMEIIEIFLILFVKTNLQLNEIRK